MASNILLKDIPCKDCITFTMCRDLVIKRIKLINKLKDMKIVSGYQFSLIYSISERCSIIRKYYKKNKGLDYTSLILETFDIRDDEK